MSDLSDRLTKISERVSARRSSFDVDGKRTARRARTAGFDPGLWNNPARATQVTSKLSRLTSEIGRYEALQRKVDDARALDEP